MAFALPDSTKRRIIRLAREGAPLEVCGFLASSRTRKFKVYPIKNQLLSPVRFYMDPEEMLAVFKKIESRGEELVAIYHSHPNGPSYPSSTDWQEDYYPEMVKLIAAPEGGRWRLNAFFKTEGGYQRLTADPS